MNVPILSEPTSHYAERCFVQVVQVNGFQQSFSHSVVHHNLFYNSTVWVQTNFHV